MNKTKTFVLDTNVLIHDPKALFSFADNKVAIPITVIEELDGLKRENEERGANARSVSRILDSFRQKGKLSEGVKMDNGGLLKVEVAAAAEDLPYQFAISKADHRILAAALNLQKNGEKVTLVSKDINMRIKAEVLGLTAKDYEKEKVRVEELYKGFREVIIPREKIDQFYSKKSILIEDIFAKKTKKKQEQGSDEIYPNEFFILKDTPTSSRSALAKYEKKDNCLVPLFHHDAAPWGIKPLNVEQRFAFELLLCNELSLITLIGVPGAGKTLLSLACGLQKVVEEKHFRHLLVARPVVPMGRDIGYLPGTKEEKLSSWMGAIYDNLDFLMDKAKTQEQNAADAIDYLFDTGILEIEALTFIRGRSLPEQFIIIDDAQNLTPHEIKTIISRAGNGTKIILTGDPFQIDNPYLDSSSNGLTYLVQRFKGQEMFGHLNFTRSERSPLASLAAELL